MTTVTQPRNERRKVYVVLSPRSLGYARWGFQSLLQQSIAPIKLTLITDSEDDKRQLEAAISPMIAGSEHELHVASKVECDDRAERQFAGLTNLQDFRNGHPCWRKITDPLLFAQASQELILLDPDLFFPNRFTFEPTPESGILLMWQRPNCLVPPEVVNVAFDKGIRLIHHADIGVAHWRANVDLHWCDWLIGLLGGSQLPRAMHIEPIIWSALAVRVGGAYLNPDRWLCWRRSQWKRAVLRAGVRGSRLLRLEPLAKAKCFHAGGEAKWWLEEAATAGYLSYGQILDQPSACLPLVELQPKRYNFEIAAKRLLKGLGYNAIFGR